MGDRPGSMYFDTRIGVIRDYSGNYQIIQIFENREIQKIQKINSIFFKILPRPLVPVGVTTGTKGSSSHNM
jgi:hypothetical protein